MHSECIVKSTVILKARVSGFFFSRVLRDSKPRFVGPLVRRSVTLYFFGVYGDFGYTAPAQMLY